MAISFHNVLVPLKRYLRRHQLIRDLNDMDDRLLDDIGITRFDIRAVAEGHWAQKKRNGIPRQTPQQASRSSELRTVANDNNQLAA